MMDTVRMLGQLFVNRLRMLRDADYRELGASALEWAVIAAVSVLIAVAVGVTISKVVTKQGNNLQNCAAKQAHATTKC